MGHWTCSAGYCRALAEEGGFVAQVTWPVRVARWWERRRGAAWTSPGGEDPSLDVTALWERVERAFRLLDVADGRPDPALTRLVAMALLDEVEACLPELGDADARAALARAVGVVRGARVQAS